MTFDDSFFADVGFTPCVRSVSVQGAPRATYPAAPVNVKASVQSRQITRLDDMGHVISATRFEVFLRDSPAALNGGLGVRQDDRFTWGGRSLFAVGDGVQECVQASLVPVWRVECVARD